MPAAPSYPTGTLEFPAGLLNLEYTLTNGQMFRWRRSRDGWWDAVSAGRMLRLRLASTTDQTDTFEFATYPGEPDADFARRYLRLSVDLETLYGSWSEADPYLGSLGDRFRGLRIVAQDPEECLLSFICSTANFIPRIMKAIATIAQTWGDPITNPAGEVLTHAFPAAQVIAGLDPVDLAERTGLEWRAANLVKVASQLASRPEGWLSAVAQLDYATARGELQQIDGVGPKISDCVCLFAMQKDQAVPVDTHVWQLTRDRYLPGLRGKTLTPTAYAQVLAFYQSRFEKAGWAQQYLFYDHLLESREKRPRRSAES
jgi:N-glycosylase/DNA lyase